MKHQSVALKLMRDRKYYGLFMEQGTGKTWCLLADAEHLFKTGKITGMLVIAPNNVHLNWARREIPQHLSVPHATAAWLSGAPKRYRDKVERILDTNPGKLAILCINIEALLSASGLEMAERFVKTFGTLIVMDESSRIKNPNAGCTKRAIALRSGCAFARIATGTPATNAPVDVFSQMEFLKSGLLGTTSHRAFTATYAELLSSEHPMMVNMIKRNPRMAHAQIIKRDVAGRPMWRNLDRLQMLLAPHTYRILKSECLDLPPKIYKQHFFTLTSAQRQAYLQMEDECRMQIGDEIIPVQALAAATKLQQITSGFVLHEGKTHYVIKNNPRLEALVELVSDIDGQFIVWARFREEIRAIHAALIDEGLFAATYFGDTSREEREAAVDDFQAGRVRALISNQQSGGLGLTLTAAQTAIYYSNDYSLEHRLQSEDRCHRKGTKGSSVVYIDLVADGSIDETIAAALCSKSDMAAAIVGDLKKTKHE